ncbi:MAG: hypothetical protein ACOYMG_17515 [Candidatus Methylumidiphilus sp.]
MGQNGNDAIKALEKLTEGTDGKSQTQKLLGVIDQIEAALAAGIRRATVLETLRPTLGITMNLNGFQTSLYRIRKRRRQGNAAATGQANAAVVVKPTVTTGTSLVVAANQPSHLPVVAEPAITPLNRGNLTFNEKMAKLKIETAKSLDEDDFIDEWDYENGNEDKHENSSS